MNEEKAKKLFCPLSGHLCLGSSCYCWGYDEFTESELCKYFG